MRLSTGTGVVLIAVGAVLAFAVSPPRWILQYVDVMSLGLVLVWVGALILAIHAYLNWPRRARRPRTSTPRAHDDDRYAPGRFASPREDAQTRVDPHAGAHAWQDDATVAHADAPAPYADPSVPTRPRRRTVDEDPATQYLPRRRP